MEPIYSFTLALFLTIALIPPLIRFSAKLGLMDAPDHRKVHQRVIPRSGGLAIVLAVVVPLLLLIPREAPYIQLLLGGAIIALFGFLDDRNNLSYRWKFVGQIIAVLLVMQGGILVNELPLLGMHSAPAWLVYPVTFFFILGVTNAVNLSDGLDGLAAGTTLLALAVVALFAWQAGLVAIGVIAVTLCGAILGFLRYNTFPARIFMGDLGSQFLGFFAVCLAIMVSQAPSSAVSPVIPLLVFGLPVLDTLMVMGIRIKEGRSPFAPDKNHLHHQIMSFGFYHYEAVAIIYLMQIALLTMAYLACYESDLLLLGGYAVLGGVLMAALYTGQVRSWRFRVLSRDERGRERRNQFLRRQEWLFHYSGLILEIFLGAILIGCALAITLLAPLELKAPLVLLLVLGILWPMLWHFPQMAARLLGYVASVYMMYVITSEPSLAAARPFVDGALIAMVLFLLLAIRTTRREDFRLDNQDLLVLAVVLVAPALSFDMLNQYEVGGIALRLAVLMYCCEFIIAKRKTRHFWVLNAAALSSLGIVTLI